MEIRVAGALWKCGHISDEKVYTFYYYRKGILDSLVAPVNFSF